MATAIRRRRRFPVGTVFGAIAVVFLLGFVYLASGNTIPLPFTDAELSLPSAKAEEPKKDPNALKDGYVWVFRAGRDLRAYQAVVNDDLFEVRGGKLDLAKYQWPKDRVEKDGVYVVDRIAELRGRVLKSDKLKGFVFSEGDFYEKGTKPGFTAGIPEGYQGIRLELGAVKGLPGLTKDDRFDVIAVIEKDDKKKAKPTKRSEKLDSFNKKREELLGLEEEEEEDSWTEQVVSNGIVVTGTLVRSEMQETSSLMNGTRSTAVGRQEMLVAIKREECAKFVEMLGTKTKLFCLPYSGRAEVMKELKAGDAPASAGPLIAQEEEEDEDRPEYGMIEQLKGSSRSVELVVDRDATRNKGEGR